MHSLYTPNGLILHSREVSQHGMVANVGSIAVAVNVQSPLKPETRCRWP